MSRDDGTSSKKGHITLEGFLRSKDKDGSKERVKSPKNRAGGGPVKDKKTKYAKIPRTKRPQVDKKENTSETIGGKGLFQIIER